MGNNAVIDMNNYLTKFLINKLQQNATVIGGSESFKIEFCLNNECLENLAVKPNCSLFFFFIITISLIPLFVLLT